MAAVAVVTVLVMVSGTRQSIQAFVYVQSRFTHLSIKPWQDYILLPCRYLRPDKTKQTDISLSTPKNYQSLHLERRTCTGKTKRLSNSIEVTQEEEEEK